MGFLLGLWIGSFVGFFIACLFHVYGEDDRP